MNEQYSNNCTYSHQPLRVVHMAPLGAGGISSMVINLCSHMDRSKVNFDYLVFRNEEEFFELKARMLGGKKLVADVSSYQVGIKKGIVKLAKTYKVLKSNQVKIFHINASTPYDILLSIVAKIAGVKVIIFHSHNTFFSTNSFVKKILINICRPMISCFSDCNIACSQKAAQFMFSNSVNKNKQYILLKNGIEVEKYIFNVDIRNEFRTRYHCEDKFVIGHIGRFTYQKNHERVIEIFKTLKSKRDNAVLFLIGEGELFNNIKQKVHDLDLDDCVFFMGTSDEVYKFLQMFDMFLLPSRFEGLPVVVIEAQAADLPVVLSNEITEEVKLTDKVYFVNLNEDNDSWADTCINAYNSNPKRHNNFDLITQTGYNITTVSKQLQDLYLYFSIKNK